MTPSRPALRSRPPAPAALRGTHRDHSVVDHHLVAAVGTAIGSAAGEAFQTSSIDALMHGDFDGDLTLAELVAHGDHGLGTVQALDGELVVVDGECFQIRSDGTVLRPPPDTRTPFAVVTRFSADAGNSTDIGISTDTDEELTGPLTLQDLTEHLDAVAEEATHPILAVRVDGTFDRAALRSVPCQRPPYPPLSEVVRHQTNWEVEDVVGTVVGFRFPVELQGVEVAGYHLHLISQDRTVGGHVTDLSVRQVRVRTHTATELHVEVPAGTSPPVPHADAATAEAIRAVEG